MRGRSRVWAADVTAAAEVSTTVVSFVLNGRDAGSASATIRTRVPKVAEELRYRSNHVAHGLRQCFTSSTDLVTDAVMPFPFGGRLLAITAGTAEAFDQVLLMIGVGHRTGRVGETIAALEHRQVDITIYATMGFTELAEAPESRTLLVLANRVAPISDLSSAGSDSVGGATVALEYLANFGHQHVVILDGHYDPGSPNSGNISSPIRWDAFRRAVKCRSVEARHVGTGRQIDDGHAAALTAPDAPPGERPTTPFAVYDRIAAGALLVAMRPGPDVPGDVPIIGFDDQKALAGHVVPALTTAALPYAAMGEAAVRMTLDAASGGSETLEHPVLPCLLAVRGPTAPPPMGAGQARYGALGTTS